MYCTVGEQLPRGRHGARVGGAEEHRDRGFPDSEFQEPSESGVSNSGQLPERQGEDRRGDTGF